MNKFGKNQTFPINAKSFQYFDQKCCFGNPVRAGPNSAKSAKLHLVTDFGKVTSVLSNEQSADPSQPLNYSDQLVTICGLFGLVERMSLSLNESFVFRF